MEKEGIKKIAIKFKSRSCCWAVFILFGLLLFTSGCDNSLEPFNNEKGFYSIYGSLNLYADTNYVRIKNLNITLNDDTTNNLDATVMLKNLSDGSSEVLKDSTIKFDNVVTHNFYSDAEIAGASEYQVTVNGPDGKSASINATTPYDSNISVDPGEVKDACQARVVISFKPYMKLSSMSASVSFTAENREDGTAFYTFEPEMELRDVDQQGDGTKIISFTPFEAISDQFQLLSLVEDGANPCSVLRSDIFSLSFRIYGPGFDGTVSDSIKIPGGEGRFVAFSDSTFRFQIPAVSPFIETN